MTPSDAVLPASLRSIAFDNSYARELTDGFYAEWAAAKVPAPALVSLNRDLATELNLDAAALASPQGAAVLSGNLVPPGAQPIAQAYAGHQFGGFSPQLGDGRALLLGEVIDVLGHRRDIAFKGSGRTPFSRGGDGKAVLGAALREHVMGEAMHALGIPTTRALAVVATGERVRREESLPGAVLTRVAASHVRVGTFEFFASRDDVTRLRRLADYVLARHDADVAYDDDRYLQLLARVVQRQAVLIAQWMGVGFIHGVMNTDNMTISGETIDYGPCAFMEAYDPAAVFSSIDTHGRYAYGNQPAVAQWNLARLAQSLLPLIDEDADAAVAKATTVVEGFVRQVSACRLAVMRDKLGLDQPWSAPAGAVPQGHGTDHPHARAQAALRHLDIEDANHAVDLSLAQDGLELMKAQRVDFTLGFRGLVQVAEGHDASWLAQFEQPTEARAWLERLKARWAPSPTQATDRAAALRSTNPMVIARNHRVEEALAAATRTGDLAPFEALLRAVSRPFEERPLDDPFVGPAPPEQTAAYRTYCGT